MKFNTRLFLTLWLAGVIGALSFLLVDLNSLIKALPLLEGEEIPPITTALKLLGLVQPAVLLAIAVWMGVFLAPKVGLSAPLAEAIAGGGDKIRALRPQVIPGIIGGLVGGIAISVVGMASKQFLPLEIVRRVSDLGQIVPLPTRILYGGITEELLLRWGVMTLFVWLGWRIFQKGDGSPQPVYLITAIIASSLLFAVGHLPIALLLFPNPTLAYILFVLVGNSTFGLVAGYLYWKKGLESAMIAHTFAHVILFVASWLELYF